MKERKKGRKQGSKEERKQEKEEDQLTITILLQWYCSRFLFSFISFPDRDLMYLACSLSFMRFQHCVTNSQRIPTHRWASEVTAELRCEL